MCKSDLKQTWRLINSMLCIFWKVLLWCLWERNTDKLFSAQYVKNGFASDAVVCVVTCRG